MARGRIEFQTGALPMKTSATLLPILVAIGGLLLAQSVRADSVIGTFELDGKKLKPASVAAFRVRAQQNPRDFATHVMLSTSPMNLEAIAAATDPYMAAINDEAVMQSDHLGFQVNPDGTVSMNAHVGGTQYLDSSGKIMGMTGSLVADCTTNTPERVTCSVATKKPVKAMGGNTWSVDIKFDTAVLKRATGTPLPTDGGDPGKALAALIKAAQGDDLAAITALLAPDMADQYQRDYNTPAENLKSAKDFLENTLPKKHKITGGELRDADTALLEVEGEPFAGKRVLYLVTLKRTDGKWGYVFAQWVGSLK